MTFKMEHAVDPRKEIIESIGNLDDIKIYNNWILVGVYKRPEKTAGGIILHNDTRKEDEYQGKVGLVLKKGPLAYVDDEKTSFGGQNIDVGEWTVFRSSDGWTLQINGVLCRMLQDVQIKMAVPKPDIVF